MRPTSISPVVCESSGCAEQKERGKASRAFPRSCDNYEIQLELQADGNFYLPWIINLESATPGLKGAKIGRITEVGLAGVCELVVIEHVGERCAKLGSEVFGNHQVLLDVKVHVPEGHAAEVADAAVAAIVDAKDGLAKAIVDRFWILEHVRRSVASKFLAAWREFILTGSAEAVATTDVDGILVIADVATVHSAEGLAAGIGRRRPLRSVNTQR